NGIGSDSGSVDELTGKGMVMPKKFADYYLKKHSEHSVERSIRKIRGVHSAIVSLNVPPRSVFLRGGESLEPTANVMVSLADSGDFKRIAATIVVAVSTGLGVPREGVTVTSDDGRVYSETQDGGLSRGDYSDLLGLELKASSTMTSQAQMALERLFPGKVHVQVSVHYENTVSSSEERIVPEDKVLTNESSYKTSTKNGSPTSTGDPNIGSTQGSSTVEPSRKTDMESTVTQTQKSYEGSVGKKRTIPLAPKIERISVFLAIDESIQSHGDQIVSQVKNLVGWDEKRDLPLEAMPVKFPEVTEPPVEEPGMFEMVKGYLPVAGQVLSILLVILFLKGLLKKHRPQAITVPTETEQPDEGDSSKEAKRLRREIEKVVNQDPASVSRLLEGWLAGKAD
ncbi:MAG: flagellar M-ring protein FliF C-terminal domain-containing protein, partial [Planctomycetota bacterium]